MSVLWIIPKDDSEQRRLRRNLVHEINKVSALIQMWRVVSERQDDEDEDADGEETEHEGSEA